MVDLGWACQGRVLDRVNLIFLSAPGCRCLAPLFLFGLLSACCACASTGLGSSLAIYYFCPCSPRGSPLLVVVQARKARQGRQVRGWREPLPCSMGAAGQRAAEPHWEPMLGLGSGLLSPNSCQGSQGFSSRVRDLCWDLSCLFLNWRVRCHSGSDF